MVRPIARTGLRFAMTCRRRPLLSGCSKLLAIGAGVGFAGLWSVPLARAISYWRWSLGYFKETSSTDAAGDLRYSGELIEAYSISLLAAWGLVWLLARRPSPLLALPLVVLGVVAIRVWRIHPEVPIHLFPVMPAWQPAELSVATLGFALFIVGRRRARADPDPAD